MRTGASLAVNQGNQVSLQFRPPCPSPETRFKLRAAIPSTWQGPSNGLQPPPALPTCALQPARQKRQHRAYRQIEVQPAVIAPGAAPPPLPPPPHRCTLLAAAMASTPASVRKSGRKPARSHHDPELPADLVPFSSSGRRTLLVPRSVFPKARFIHSLPIRRRRAALQPTACCHAACACTCRQRLPPTAASAAPCTTPAHPLLCRRRRCLLASRDGTRAWWAWRSSTQTACT